MHPLPQRRPKYKIAWMRLTQCPILLAVTFLIPNLPADTGWLPAS